MPDTLLDALTTPPPPYDGVVRRWRRRRRATLAAGVGTTVAALTVAGALVASAPGASRGVGVVASPAAPRLVPATWSSVQAVDAQHLFAIGFRCGQGGCARAFAGSGDGGRTWTDLHVPAHADGALTVIDARHLIAYGAALIATSGDAGEHWATRSSEGLPVPQGGSTGQLVDAPVLGTGAERTVVLDPGTGSTVTNVTQPPHRECGPGVGLLQSDGAVTAVASQPAPAKLAGDLSGGGGAVWFTTAGYSACGGRRGPRSTSVSTDGGGHWTPVSSPPGNVGTIQPVDATTAYALDVPSRGPARAGTTSFRVVRTTDGGRSWQTGRVVVLAAPGTGPFGRTGSYTQLVALASGRLLASAGDTVSLSVDGGATWRPVLRGTSGHSVGVTVAGDTLVAVDGAGAVSDSRDAGATWSPTGHL